MLKVFVLNIKSIGTIFLFSTSIFMLLFVSMVFFSKGEHIYLYPVLTAFGIGVFITVMIFSLELIRTYQENRFFKKQPYSLIEKLTIERKYIKDKLSLYKLHRIFEIENVRYEAVFHSEILKEGFGNALVILKETDEKEWILYLIDYKGRKFDEHSLLEELKNIKAE